MAISGPLRFQAPHKSASVAVAVDPPQANTRAECHSRFRSELLLERETYDIRQVTLDGYLYYREFLPNGG